MKLRTLKDLQTFYKKGFKLGEIETYETELGKGELIEKRDLKAEAIKWVKEDIEEFGLFKDVISLQTRKWMKRLNIKEEDLK